MVKIILIQPFLLLPHYNADNSSNISVLIRCPALVKSTFSRHTGLHSNKETRFVSHEHYRSYFYWSAAVVVRQLFHSSEHVLHAFIATPVNPGQFRPMGHEKQNLMFQRRKEELETTLNKPKWLMWLKRKTNEHLHPSSHLSDLVFIIGTKPAQQLSDVTVLCPVLLPFFATRCCSPPPAVADIRGNRRPGASKLMKIGTNKINKNQTVLALLRLYPVERALCSLPDDATINEIPVIDCFKLL